MTKKEQKYKWHVYVFLGLLNFCIAIFIGAKGSTYLVAGMSYAEMSSSKINSIVFALSELEATNWRYVIIAVLTFLSWLYFNIANNFYKSNKKKK